MKKLFIGIDFSKESFDASFFRSEELGKVYHSRFENDEKGFKALMEWVCSLSTEKRVDWLFCGEHTGLYSVPLTHFLLKKKLFVWLENPLQIKRSMGIRREKSDKADSKEIALYAYRHQDKARAYQLPDKSFEDLQMLLSFRERLIKNKTSLEVSSSEMRRIHKRDTTARFIYEQSERDIARIKKEIKAIEKKMIEIIDDSPALKENYDLTTSVKGIGMINAVTIIIRTQNFTSFENSRQFSCYGGVAPFKNSSGSSINKGTHISNIANKQIKVLLTQAAFAAVLHDKELGAYYRRKVAEGKHKNVALNNVRNKLLHRVFAVVRNKEPYRENYRNQHIPRTNISEI